MGQQAPADDGMPTIFSPLSCTIIHYGAISPNSPNPGLILVFVY